MIRNRRLSEEGLDDGRAEDLCDLEQRVGRTERTLPCEDRDPLSSIQNGGGSLELMRIWQTRAHRADRSIVVFDVPRIARLACRVLEIDRKIEMGDRSSAQRGSTSKVGHVFDV